MIFHWYGFFLGLGIVCGVISAQWLVSRVDAKLSTHVDALSLWVVIGGIIGARIYHLVTDWQLYVGASFIDYIAVWRGGLGLWGALIGGLIGLYFYTKKYHFLWESKIVLLDGIGFGLPLAQAIGRIGNGINQELFGKATSLPWGISIQHSAEKFHPLFMYESILLCIVWLGMRWAVIRHKGLVGTGNIFAVWLIVYGCMRFGLEYLRFSTAQLGIFSVAQWVSIIAVFLGCTMLKKVRL